MACNTWPELLDLTFTESRSALRSLELEAYANVVSVLRAQGDLTPPKKSILNDLQQLFGISVERHRAEVRRAINDEKLCTLSAHLSGASVHSSWQIEGRRLMPLIPRAAPLTFSAQIANKAAKKQRETNKRLPPPQETGKDIYAPTPRPPSPQHVGTALLPMSQQLSGTLEHFTEQQEAALSTTIAISTPTGAFTASANSSMTGRCFKELIEKELIPAVVAQQHASAAPAAKSQSSSTYSEKDLSSPPPVPPPPLPATVASRRRTIDDVYPDSIKEERDMFQDPVKMMVTRPVLSAVSSTMTVASRTQQNAQRMVVMSSASDFSISSPHYKESADHMSGPMTHTIRTPMAQGTSVGTRVTLTSARKPLVHIRQQAGMKIITQSIAAKSRSYGSTSNSSSGGYMGGSRTPSSASMGMAASKVINLSHPRGSAPPHVSMQPKMVQIKGSSASPATTRTPLPGKPNVIVVQKGSARRYSTPIPSILPQSSGSVVPAVAGSAGIGGGGTQVLTLPRSPPTTSSQSPFEKELVSFIRRHDTQQRSVPNQAKPTERRVLTKDGTTITTSGGQQPRRITVVRQRPDGGMGQHVAFSSPASGSLPYNYGGHGGAGDQPALIDEDDDCIITEESRAIASITSQPGTVYTSQPGAGYTSQPGAGYTSHPGTGYTSQPGAGYAYNTSRSHLSHDTSAISALLDLQRSQVNSETNQPAISVQRTPAKPPNRSAHQIITINRDGHHQSTGFNQSAGVQAFNQSGVMQPFSVSTLTNQQQDFGLFSTNQQSQVLSNNSQQVIGDLDPFTGRVYDLSGHLAAEGQITGITPLGDSHVTAITPLDPQPCSSQPALEVSESQESFMDLTSTGTSEQSDSQTQQQSQDFTEEEEEEAGDEGWADEEPGQYEEDEPQQPDSSGFVERSGLAEASGLVSGTGLAGGSGLVVAKVTSLAPLEARQDSVESEPAAATDAAAVVPAVVSDEPKMRKESPPPVLAPPPAPPSAVDCLQSALREAEIVFQSGESESALSTDEEPAQAVRPEVATTAPTDVAPAAAVGVVMQEPSSEESQTDDDTEVAQKQGPNASVQLLEYDPHSFAVSAFTSQMLQQQQLSALPHQLGGSEMDNLMDGDMNQSRVPPPGPPLSPSRVLAGHNVPGWRRLAIGLLQRVSRFRGANKQKGDLDASAWFTLPVDPLDVPDYYEIIKNPMDFSTIKRKLEAGHYSDWAGFHEDMMLVQRNCHQYNPPNDPIRQDCDQVFKYYLEEFARIKDRWYQGTTTSPPPPPAKRPRIDL